jgi:DNA-binding response OmpR family regulator
MRILVIEDDASIRETLGMVLEAYHHESILVGSGENALSFLRSDWPDLMLLDLTLQGMTGEEVYRAVLSEFGKVPPTLVISAAHEGAARTKDLPGAWFLSKPYTIEELADMIERVVASPAA